MVGVASYEARVFPIKTRLLKFLSRVKSRKECATWIFYVHAVSVMRIVYDLLIACLHALIDAYIKVSFAPSAGKKKINYFSAITSHRKLTFQKYFEECAKENKKKRRGKAKHPSNLLRDLSVKYPDWLFLRKHFCLSVANLFLTNAKKNSPPFLFTSDKRQRGEKLVSHRIC